MDKLGTGYDDIRERNPAIVYGCVRGFGDPRTDESPYVSWPVYDVVAQSMSGHASITGPKDGKGGYPGGVSVGDIYPGTLMALGVVSAILNARETGEGQFLDVAMYDAMLLFSETVITNYSYGEKELEPRGQHHPNLMPFGIFPTSDGSVAIAALSPKHRGILCAAMERLDLIDDERSKNIYKRKTNQVFVEAQISAWTSSVSKAEIVAALGGVVSCGPVNTASDIYNDPHVAIREMITRFQLPGDNPEVSIAGSPIKYTKTKTGFYRRPPLLGEHTDEILDEFNLSRKK